MRAARALTQALLTIPVVGFWIWAIGALCIDGPTTHLFAASLAGGVAIGLGVAGLGCLVFVRPYRRALLALALISGAVLFWWLRIPPSNDRDWQPDVARPARAQIEGNRVTIENVRNFNYRSETDFDQTWETRTYDLDKLRGIDLFISFWGPTLYAHTIMSWEFEGSPPLAISIETRKEKGETYSALLGFFRQFEQYYVVADERDVIGVRDRFRGEHTYLYRLAAPVAAARALLLDYLGYVNGLADQPEWYNAMTQNCTTSIRNRVMQAGGQVPLDWRLLLNGRLDELLYERGSLSHSLPFAELKQKSEVTQRAIAAGESPDFWARIREGIPDYPR
ncbi:MAG: DUF4105 domain-containing protein [Myxococcota bacterium]